jgi:hypothetical protein
MEKTLQTKIEDLTSRTKDNDCIIKSKLQDKDNEIQILKLQMKTLQESHKEILGLLKDPSKLIEILK